MSIRNHTKTDVQEAIELGNYMEQRDADRMKVINQAWLLPRQKKWRAIVDLYANEVPGLKEQMVANSQLAKQQREDAGIWNKKVETENGTMRLGLTMPPAVLTIIETCDPEFKEIMSSNENPAAQKKMFKLLCKTFKEFVVPQDLMT